MRKVEIKIPKKEIVEEPEMTEMNDEMANAEVDMENVRKMAEISARVEAETNEHLSKIIMWATPMSLQVKLKKQNNMVINIVTLTFLCVDGLNKFFTINRNYLLDTPEEHEALKDLDLYTNNMGNNIKIVVNQIINRSDCYVTEFKFKVDNVDSKVIKLPCFHSTSGDEVEFEVNVDTYMGIKYIEDMIFRCAVDEDRFFNFATLIASKGTYSTGFFKIEDVDNIVAMTSGVRTPNSLLGRIKTLFKRGKSTDNLAIAIKARRRPPKPLPHYENKTAPEDIAKAEQKAEEEWAKMEDEEVVLMLPFNTDGVKYGKEKFRGVTIEQMENLYYGAENQYATTLTNTDLEVAGENYLAIRGKNAAGEAKAFLISDEVMKKINTLIEEF